MIWLIYKDYWVISNKHDSSGRRQEGQVCRTWKSSVIPQRNAQAFDLPFIRFYPEFWTLNIWNQTLCEHKYCTCLQNSYNHRTMLNKLQPRWKLLSVKMAGSSLAKHTATVNLTKEILCSVFVNKQCHLSSIFHLYAYVHCFFSHRFWNNLLKISDFVTCWDTTYSLEIVTPHSG